MVKGIFAERKALFRFFFLFVSLLFWFSLLQLLGIGLVEVLYGVSAESLFANGQINAWNALSRNALRLLQFFAVSGLFVAGPAFYIYFTQHNPERFAGLNTNPKVEASFWLVVGMLALSPLVDGILRLSQHVLSLYLPNNWWQNLELAHEKALDQMAIFLECANWGEWALAFIVVACLPALAEEFFFRGVLQPELQRYLGLHPGIWLASLVFALVHGQVMHFPGLLLFGLALGYVRQYGKSLWYSILAHFANNAAVFFMVLGESDIRSALDSGNTWLIWWQYALAFVAALAIWGRLIYLFKK